MKLTRLFTEFFESEKAGGFILILVTIFSLIMANSGLGAGYSGIWERYIGGHTIVSWINDGLMTIFFLMIGLELEREIYAGELSNIKKASLPFFAAIGGMVVPAGIYMIFSYDTVYRGGAGIPTATDIAFAIGILSLVGNRVPASLKIFLTALAVIDDLGAIIIISIFYSEAVILQNLFIALGTFVFLVFLNRVKVNNLIPYVAGGLVMWFFMEKSGVHATISGVLLAFAIPFRGEGSESPSYRLQHRLHFPVAFFVLPLFALANTAIPLEGGFSGLSNPPSTGIIAGLVVGKPLGILLFSFAAVAAGLSDLPYGLKWRVILGTGLLGGIGFTMSIFITLLAFTDPVVINISKIAILIASLVSGIGGFIILKFMLREKVDDDDFISEKQ